jgi:hypothetical protein
LTDPAGDGCHLTGLTLLHLTPWVALGVGAAGDRRLVIPTDLLRRKLETDPPRPTMFITDPGIGYRLVVDRRG